MRPQDFSNGRAETGPCLIFIAEVIAFSQAMGSTLIDIGHGMYVKHHGYDRQTFEKNASQLETRIQENLGKRRLLVGSGDLEQALLQDVGNSASVEFIGNYSRAARLQAFRTGIDVGELYTLSTGAFWGGLMEYLTAVHMRPKYAGSAGVGFIASGAGFIVHDSMAYWAGRITQSRIKKRMLAKRNLMENNIKQLASDLSRVPAGYQHQEVYRLIEAVMQKDRDLTALENKEMFHKYLHEQTINGAEGAANVAAGSVLASAGFQFSPHLRAETQLPQIIHNNSAFLNEFGTSALVFTPTGAAAF